MKKKKLTIHCLILDLIDLWENEKHLSPSLKNLYFLNGETILEIDKFNSVSGFLYISLKKIPEKNIGGFNFRDMILELLRLAKIMQKGLASEIIFTDYLENIYKIIRIDNTEEKSCSIFLDKSRLV